MVPSSRAIVAPGLLSQRRLTVVQYLLLATRLCLLPCLFHRCQQALASDTIFYIGDVFNSIVCIEDYLAYVQYAHLHLLYALYASLTNVPISPIACEYFYFNIQAGGRMHEQSFIIASHYVEWIIAFFPSMWPFGFPHLAPFPVSGSFPFSCLFRFPVWPGPVSRGFLFRFPVRLFGCCFWAACWPSISPYLIGSVAQKEAEHAINMRQMLASIPTTIGPSASVNMASVPMTPQVETSLVTPPMLPSHNQQPITSSMNSITSVEDEHKKAAAAVAAKLAASTSSAQVLTSILSSLVAEEAASMNGSQSSGFITSSNPMLPPDKRPKLEKPMSITDMNSKFFGHITQQQQHQHQLPSLPLLLPQSSSTSIQPISHSSQPLQSFATQPPPLPSAPPPSMQPQTYIQSSGVLMNSVPFGYNGSPLPPPSFPSHVSVGMTRPNAPTQPPPPATPPQPKQQHPQQQPPTGGFFPSPGIGFYGQLPAAPPVPRQ
ncbi:hypothetical protein IEQ34_005192 [Dendrobium chrysotoxum]|uniref:Uncharacterized protein n=1 Tax=Dendrobium chrysotoxum TaxID=161865 RepID=A0AAV7GUD0_DENCH|nr:hypothetical protein IEQ34_005192 [Dendrobium chrysotoxum]